MLRGRLVSPSCRGRIFLEVFDADCLYTRRAEEADTIAAGTRTASSIVKSSCTLSMIDSTTSLQHETEVELVEIECEIAFPPERYGRGSFV